MALFMRPQGIAEIVGFLDPAVFRWFNLPLEAPA
jgi:hypothetical protein